jgi:hypothetical protein
MNYISPAYNSSSHDNQEFRGEPVEILSLDDALCSVAEWNAFQRKMPSEPRDITHRRHAICLLFQQGGIGAVEAMHALYVDDLWGDPDYFLAAYAAGVAALSNRTPPESPDVAPGSTKAPPPVSRVQELIDALAPARMGRSAA